MAETVQTDALRFAREPGCILAGDATPYAQRAARHLLGPDAQPLAGSGMLASSDKYGAIVVPTPEGAAVCRLADTLPLFAQQGATEMERASAPVPIHTALSYPTQSPILTASLASDGDVLASSPGEDVFLHSLCDALSTSRSHAVARLAVGPVTCLAWSGATPSRLAVLTADGVIHICSTEGGIVRSSAGYAAVLGMDWSAQNELMLAATDRVVCITVAPDGALQALAAGTPVMPAIPGDFNGAPRAAHFVKALAPDIALCAWRPTVAQPPAEDTAELFLVYLCTRTAGAWSTTCLGGPLCEFDFRDDTLQLHKQVYMAAHVREWGLTLLSSSISPKVAVIGRRDAAGAGGGAALAVYELQRERYMPGSIAAQVRFEETTVLGAIVNRNDDSNVPPELAGLTGDAEPPAPRLLLLCSHGAITSQWIVTRTPEGFPLLAPVPPLAAPARARNAPPVVSVPTTSAAPAAAELQPGSPLRHVGSMAAPASAPATIAPFLPSGIALASLSLPMPVSLAGASMPSATSTGLPPLGSLTSMPSFGVGAATGALPSLGSMASVFASLGTSKPSGVSIGDVHAAGRATPIDLTDVASASASSKAAAPAPSVFDGRSTPLAMIPTLSAHPEAPSSLVHLPSSMPMLGAPSASTMSVADLMMKPTPAPAAAAPAPFAVPRRLRADSVGMLTATAAHAAAPAPAPVEGRTVPTAAVPPAPSVRPADAVVAPPPFVSAALPATVKSSTSNTAVKFEQLVETSNRILASLVDPADSRGVGALSAAHATQLMEDMAALDAPEGAPASLASIAKACEAAASEARRLAGAAAQQTLDVETRIAAAVARARAEVSLHVESRAGDNPTHAPLDAYSAHNRDHMRNEMNKLKRGIADLDITASMLLQSRSAPERRGTVVKQVELAHRVAQKLCISAAAQADVLADVREHVSTAAREHGIDVSAASQSMTLERSTASVQRMQSRMFGSPAAATRARAAAARGLPLAPTATAVAAFTMRSSALTSSRADVRAPPPDTSSLSLFRAARTATGNVMHLVEGRGVENEAVRRARYAGMPATERAQVAKRAAAHVWGSSDVSLTFAAFPRSRMEVVGSAPGAPAAPAPAPHVHFAPAPAAAISAPVVQPPTVAPAAATALALAQAIVSAAPPALPLAAPRTADLTAWGSSSSASTISVLPVASAAAPFNVALGDARLLPMASLASFNPLARAAATMPLATAPAVSLAASLSVTASTAPPLFSTLAASAASAPVAAATTASLVTTVRPIVQPDVGGGALPHFSTPLKPTALNFDMTSPITAAPPSAEPPIAITPIAKQSATASVNLAATSSAAASISIPTAAFTAAVAAVVTSDRPPLASLPPTLPRDSGIRTDGIASLSSLSAGLNTLGVATPASAIAPAPAVTAPVVAAPAPAPVMAPPPASAAPASITAAALTASAPLLQPQPARPAVGATAVLGQMSFAPATAAPAPVTLDTHRLALAAYFAAVNPENVSKVDELLGKSNNDPMHLWGRLEKKRPGTTAQYLPPGASLLPAAAPAAAALAAAPLASLASLAASMPMQLPSSLGGMSLMQTSTNFASTAPLSSMSLPQATPLMGTSGMTMGAFGGGGAFGALGQQPLGGSATMATMGFPSGSTMFGGGGAFAPAAAPPPTGAAGMLGSLSSGSEPPPSATDELHKQRLKAFYASIGKPDQASDDNIAKIWKKYHKSVWHSLAAKYPTAAQFAAGLDIPAASPARPAAAPAPSMMGAVGGSPFGALAQQAPGGGALGSMGGLSQALGSGAPAFGLGGSLGGAAGFGGLSGAAGGMLGSSSGGGLGAALGGGLGGAAAPMQFTGQAPSFGSSSGGFNLAAGFRR